MDTALNREALLEGEMQHWRSMTPMGRMGRPEELNGVCVFLASEASGFVTGSHIYVDVSHDVRELVFKAELTWGLREVMLATECFVGVIGARSSEIYWICTIAGTIFQYPFTITEHISNHTRRTCPIICHAHVSNHPLLPWPKIVKSSSGPLHR